MTFEPQRFFRLLKWRLIHALPPRDVTIATANGLLTCDNKDWLIGKYLYVNQGYETETIRATVDALVAEGYLKNEKGNGVVLDVGANVGMICVALLKENFFERAIAFEPNPNNFRLLVKNALQNDLKNRIECFPYALSSEQREADLELSPGNSGDNHLREENKRESFRKDARQIVKVPVKTLDEVAAENPDVFRAKPSLVWLDIQGHEGFFFQGARRFLSRGVPVASEFWTYGIERSGMSLADYSRIVKEIFTHFYHLRGARYEKKNIGEIDALFEIYTTQREFGQVIFVNDSARET